MRVHRLLIAAAYNVITIASAWRYVIVFVLKEQHRLTFQILYKHVVIATNDLKEKTIIEYGEMILYS